MEETKSVENILRAMVSKLGTGTSSNQPFTPNEDYYRQRAEWMNATEGSLTDADCPDCKNRGYIMRYDSTGLISVECKCMARRRSVWRMKKSGLASMLKDKTFSAFQTPEPWQEEAKAKAEAYAAAPEGWFMASGTPGSGKTHLCTAICGELLNAGREVRYMLWRDTSVKIKAAANDTDLYEELIAPLKHVPVLYIDDFFKSPQITNADINLAFELLNARYIQKKAITIISTELSMDKLLEIDEAVGSRIYERAKANYLRFEGGKNWRIRGLA